MVQPENVNSGHSNSQLGDRCGRHHHNLTHLGENIISPHRALKSAWGRNAQLKAAFNIGLVSAFRARQAHNTAGIIAKRNQQEASGLPMEHQLHQIVVEDGLRTQRASTVAQAQLSSADFSLRPCSASSASRS